MGSMPPLKEMREAFFSKNPEYDGLFVAGVRTTGVFCRPSCPARKPLSENVEFFGSAHDAVFAGFRPCKRCQPMSGETESPGWLLPLLDRIDKDPSGRVKDADVRGMGIDPARVRRYFQKRYGMTFQAYVRGRRLGRAFDTIRKGAPIDDAVFDHGYESHSGFRDAFVRFFGVPPGSTGGTDIVKAGWVESPLGPLVAFATGDGICLLEFTDRRMLEAQVARVRRVFGSAIVPGENVHMERLRAELAGYFDGTLTRFTVPCVTPGTPFQMRVWDRLRQIPYGETRSYEHIAREVGVPGASRAVGSANGRNRVSIVIPCHRVVNKDGQLGGYGGGLWRKRRLLELEQRAES